MFFFFRLFLFLSLRPIRTIDKNHDDTLPLKKFSSRRERLRILIFTLQMYDDSLYYFIECKKVTKSKCPRESVIIESKTRSGRAKLIAKLNSTNSSHFVSNYLRV